MRILKRTPLSLIAFLGFLFSASPALAETHPFTNISFGRSATESFSSPNGIAIDESTGDVYVADLGTNTVYKFDANGVPVNFSSLGTNALTGSATPAGSFLFAEGSGTPAAIAVDNSRSPSDPSAGDLYVMDAGTGHNVIDKFNSKGEYLNQITGPFSGELLGLGLDANGDVRVEVTSSVAVEPATELFDDSAVNSFVKHLNAGPSEVVESPEKIASVPVHGFATGGLSGSSFALWSCGCVGKLAINGQELGPVDSEGSGDVAVAVDPATGHVYIDDQSSVSEWDTGQMNGMLKPQGLGTLVSSFSSLQLTGASGQGGIAVNGASGDVYVSNPADGKVYVFGSTAPVVVSGAPVGVTQTSATLRGTVDPRGVPVSSCVFEYATTPLANLTLPIQHMDHTVACVTEHGEPIGAGNSPVAVHADIGIPPETLLPGSLYHFRLVAGNANGTSPSAGLFPTLTAGFGIKNFEVAFLNKDGTPDVQAGSHPFEMVTNAAYNTQIVQKLVFGDLRYIVLPAGNAKDLTFHLPPGFVADPGATTRKCTLADLEIETGEVADSNCPAASAVGLLEAEYYSGGAINDSNLASTVSSIVAPRGVALQLGGKFITPNLFINAGIPAGGDSGPVATVRQPASVGVLSFRQTVFGGTPLGSNKPFLTMPTSCNGPLTSTIEADSFQGSGHFAHASWVSLNAAGAPGGMTGCAQLKFPPSIETKPDVSNASSSSGLTAGVHISQKAALNPTGLAESGLRDLTVTLPAGVALNPADADGLEACSEGLASFTGFAEFNQNFEPGDLTATFTPKLPDPLQSDPSLPGLNFCPNGSKIGTVKIKTPLLPNPLEGAVYLAAQEANPFGGLLAMYLIAEDPVSGTIVKQTGKVSLCENTGEVFDGVTCEAPGQIVTTFRNTPNLPLEEAELHFFGGERAPLRTPSRCGTYTTKASFTPWDGNGPVNTISSFQIEHGPNGTTCPGASLPFSASANAGSTNLQAGEFSPFTLSMIRHDGEQNTQSVQATLPPGLSGMLSNIALCPEPQANEGTCPASSEIGETTVTVGVGSHPFTVTGGKDYLTVPYNGSGGCTMGTPGCAPFGLTFEVPAKAGPFDLEKTAKHHPACDCVVVRGKIEINPITSALTITSDPPGSPHAIPTMLEGIPLEIQQVNATTTRKNFQFNPTSCAKMGLVGHLFSNEGAADTIELPYQVTNCAALKFEPKLNVSTSGKTSKANGASLTAKLTYPKVPQGTDADIAKVKVELPKQLPSRLTTLQKACTAKQFAANPAGCPPESKIGYAVVHTPILPVPLEGPAIFVSHGGEAFPSLTMVLQGDNVTIDLVGTTFISKAGITSTDFKTVPDQPFSTFELTLPQGKFSALTANGNLCSSTRTVLVKRKVTVRVRGRRKTVTRKVRQTLPAPLTMPTEFVGQNGAVIKDITKIAVTGCPKKKAKKAAHHHGKGKTKKR
jgi:DNA-binding beta-propeller fold protein YncE